MLISKLETWTLRSKYQADFNVILDFVEANAPQSVVAGGFLTRYIGGEPLGGDIDLYFLNQAQLLLSKESLVNAGCRCVKEGKVVLLESPLSQYPIHLIGIKYFPSTEHVLHSFDFTVCQFAYDFKNLMYMPSSLRDLGAKSLRICSIDNNDMQVYTKRIGKYLNRGFTIDEHNLSIFLDYIRNQNPTTYNNYSVEPTTDVQSEE